MISRTLRKIVEKNSFIRRFLSLIFAKIRNFSFIFKSFKKFKNLISQNFNKSLETKNILFAGSVGMNSDNFLQSTIANYYVAKGHKVDILICDGVLKACFNCKFIHFYDDFYQKKLIAKGPNSLCNTCHQRGKKYFQSNDINIIYYSNYISEKEVKELDSSLSKLSSFQDIINFTEDGFQLGKEAYAACVRFYASPNIEEEPNGKEILKKYLLSALISKFIIEKIIKEKKYDLSFLDHGIYVPQGIISEALNKNNLKHFCVATGYRNKSYIFSENGSYHRTMPKLDLDKHIEKLEEIDQKILISEKYIKSRSTGENDWVLFHENSNKKESFNNFIDQSKINIALFSNVLWDAQIHFEEAIFKDTLEWIKTTINSTSRKKINLILRIHPGEIKGFIKSRISLYEELRKNLTSFEFDRLNIVKAEQELNSYKLAEKCDYSIVFGSKIGIEIAALGHKVIVVGDCWTREKKITIDPSSIEEYKKILRLCEEGEFEFIPNKRRALLFSYILFFEIMKEVPFIEKRENKDPQFKINFNSPAINKKDNKFYTFLNSEL